MNLNQNPSSVKMPAGMPGVQATQVSCSAHGREALHSADDPNSPQPLSDLELLQAALEFTQETYRRKLENRDLGEAFEVLIDLHLPALVALGAVVLHVVERGHYSRLGYLRDELGKAILTIDQTEDQVGSDDGAQLYLLRSLIFELLNEQGIDEAIRLLTYEERKSFATADWN